MNILSLDLGSQMGWAYGLKGQVPISSTVPFKGTRFEGGGMRFLRFRNWLTAFVKENAIDIVVFEEVRNHKGVDASHIYGGLLAILSSFCEENHVPYVGVGVGVIKKHATGKGNAGKDMMIEAMRQKGFSPKDDNEADALALWHYAIDNIAI